MAPTLAELAMAENQTSFKPGYDARRHVFYKNNGLTVYNDKLSLQLRQQKPVAVVANYMFSVMTDPNNSAELRYKAAIDIINRVDGKTIPMDRMRAMQADRAKEEAEQAGYIHTLNREQLLDVIREYVTEFNSRGFDTNEIVVNAAPG